MNSRKYVSLGLVSVLLLTLTFCTSPAAADEGDIYNSDDIYLANVTHDAYVDNGAANTNYNSKPEGNYLRLGDHWKGSICRSYFKFNLAGLYCDRINYAKTTLWAHSRSSTIPTVEIFPAGKNWDESTITWNNRPTTGTRNDYQAIGNTGGTYDYYDFNVTQAARDAHSNGGKLSLMIAVSVESNPNYWCVFASDESTGGDAELRIDYCHCPVAGNVYTQTIPSPAPVANASVNITCSNGYAKPISSDLQGAYSGTLYVKNDCSGKNITITAAKRNMGVLEWKGSTTVKAKYDDLTNNVDVYVKPVMLINTDLSFNLEPVQFAEPGSSIDTSANARIDAGGTQIETNGCETTFNFDPGLLSCTDVAAVDPFNHNLEYNINNYDGIVTVQASAAPGHYVTIGDQNSPTTMCSLSFEAHTIPAQCQFTFVDVNEAEFTTPADAVSPYYCRCGHLIGSHLRILDPNGPQQFNAGQIQPILWEATENINDINIQYSSDDGDNWQNIDTVSNALFYEWTVPDVNSAECLLRIADAFDPGVSDTSNQNFSIKYCSEELTADLDNDCSVDYKDFALFAQQWLTDG